MSQQSNSKLTPSANTTSIDPALTDLETTTSGRRPPSNNQLTSLEETESWGNSCDQPQTLSPSVVAYLEAYVRKTLPVPDRHRRDGASSKQETSGVSNNNRRQESLNADADFVLGRSFLDFCRGLI